MLKDFLLNLYENIKLVFYKKNINFYKKKFYLSPTRKIYLELTFNKKNLIGFSLNEILFNKKKRFLTNIYFYPSTNVFWLLFLELNSKKYLITREVLKTLILCFFVVKFLDKEFQILGKKNDFEIKNNIIKKLKKISKNIKIIY